MALLLKVGNDVFEDFSLLSSQVSSLLKYQSPTIPTPRFLQNESFSKRDNQFFTPIRNKVHPPLARWVLTLRNIDNAETSST